MKPMSERIEQLAVEVAGLAFHTNGKAGEIGSLAQAHLMLRRALLEMRAAEALAKKSEVRL